MTIIITIAIVVLYAFMTGLTYRITGIIYEESLFLAIVWPFTWALAIFILIPFEFACWLCEGIADAFSRRR